jgi:RNA polymerase sigma-70 factor (ECF subfamily)
VTTGFVEVANTMPQPEDNSAQLQSLLDLAARGKDDAYGELIANASDRLLRLTRKMLWNYPHLRRWEQTDDVFQTAVIRLHRSLSEVRPDSVRGFFGLATTQIRRTLIDLARHHFGPEGQGAKHHTDGGGIAADDPGGVLSNETDESNRPETLERWAAFHEAVERLPNDLREVFQLVWYGGLEQKDVAKLVGVSISTVQRRLYDARRTLSTALYGERPT